MIATLKTHPDAKFEHDWLRIQGVITLFVVFSVVKIGQVNFAPHSLLSMHAALYHKNPIVSAHPTMVSDLQETFAFRRKQRKPPLKCPFLNFFHLFRCDNWASSIRSHFYLFAIVLSVCSSQSLVFQHLIHAFVTS